MERDKVIDPQEIPRMNMISIIAVNKELYKHEKMVGQEKRLIARLLKQAIEELKKWE